MNLFTVKSAETCENMFTIKLFYCCQEGPHSVIHEEEFFDAVDATLDKLEKEEEKVSITWVIYIGNQ